MLRRVASVRTDFSGEHIAVIIVARMGELRRTLAVTSNRCALRRVTPNFGPSSPILVTLVMKALRSSETLVLVRATRRNIPEDGILHSDRRETLISYITLTGWAL
jgi:hypothetical protein